MNVVEEVEKMVEKLREMRSIAIRSMALGRILAFTLISEENSEDFNELCRSFYEDLRDAEKKYEAMTKEVIDTLEKLKEVLR